MTFTLTEHGSCYLKRQFPNFFPALKKLIVSPQRKKKVLICDLAHAVQNEALKMPPKDEKCEKTQGFEHFSFNMAEKY